MFEIRDFQTLYNMVAASFIILTFSLLYDSYFTNGQLLDMIAFMTIFAGVNTIILAWFSMATIFFCILLVTKLALRTNRYIWVPIYFCQIAANLSVACYFANSEGLGFGSVMIIMA